MTHSFPTRRSSDLETGDGDDGKGEEDKASEGTESEEGKEEEQHEQENKWHDHATTTVHRVKIGQSVESWLGRLIAPGEQPERPSTHYDGEDRKSTRLNSSH